MRCFMLAVLIAVVGLLPVSASAQTRATHLSQDQRTGFISGKTFERKKVTYSVIDGKAIFEGDIILGTAKEMEAAGSGKEADGGPSPEAVAVPASGSLWPGGIIPWENNGADGSRIQSAIHMWESRTNLSFPPRQVRHPPPYPDYVSFEPKPQGEDDCWSEIGRQRTGEQLILLGKNCTARDIAHEIGHTIGLFHEQSREDRNRFVKVLLHNVQPNATGNFDQHITDGDDVGPYDFDSIMHYGPTQFGIVDPATGTQKTTMEAVPPGETIRDYTVPSAGDAAAVRVMYEKRRPLLAGGDPRGYEAGGTARVVYAGTPLRLGSHESHIHELWLGADGWHYWDMTRALGPPGVLGQPMGYEGNGLARVIYSGVGSPSNPRLANRLYELWRVEGWLGDYWDVTYDLPAYGSGGNPMGYEGGGTARVVYGGKDGHIHELSLAADGWHHWNMTAALRAPLPSGKPMGYEGGGLARVVYRSAHCPNSRFPNCGNQHIHELSLAADGWHHWDMNAGFGAPIPSAPAAGDPMGYQGDGRARVVYRSYNGHIHELWLGADGWYLWDMTAESGAPLAAGDPIGYQGVGSGLNLRRVVYRGQDNHVHEIYRGTDGEPVFKWRHSNMTRDLPALAAGGNPMGYQAGGANRVVYRGKDSHIHELRQPAYGSYWRHEDLTPFATSTSPTVSRGQSGDRAADTVPGTGGTSIPALAVVAALLMVLAGASVLVFVFRRLC